MDIRLEIVGQRVVCKQDGREALCTSLQDFLAALHQRTDSQALPDAIPEGVRFIRRRGDAVVLVLEERPQVRTVRWLAEHSPAPMGRGATYRTAQLAFPFVILIVAFRQGAITGYLQCFYRRSSARTLDAPLLYPNLYNVVAAYGQACWLCLAKLPNNLASLSWEEKVQEIRAHLWGAGFNRSAEVNEGASYWQIMQGIDPRVASLAAWEQESKKDPFFALNVEWRPVGKTVGRVVIEMLNAIAPAPSLSCAAELAALLSLCPPCPADGKTGAAPTS
jgi:hypothetical protein